MNLPGNCSRTRWMNLTNMKRKIYVSNLADTSSVNVKKNQESVLAIIDRIVRRRQYRLKTSPIIQDDQSCLYRIVIPFNPLERTESGWYTCKCWLDNTLFKALIWDIEAAAQRIKTNAKTTFILETPTCDDNCFDMHSIIFNIVSFNTD